MASDDLQEQMLIQAIALAAVRERIVKAPSLDMTAAIVDILQLQMHVARAVELLLRERVTIEATSDGR